jgi:hypothetical protein
LPVASCQLPVASCQFLRLLAFAVVMLLFLHGARIFVNGCVERRAKRGDCRACFYLRCAALGIEAEILLRSAALPRDKQKIVAESPTLA